MKTIDRKNLPPTAPVMPTITWWLLLDRIGVGDVAWGVFYTLAVVIWAASIYALYTAEPTDIFKGK